MSKKPKYNVLTYRQMRARKTNPGWLLIGESYVRYHHIESVDDCGRWLKTSSGALHLIPKNQRARITRELYIFKS